MSKELSAETVRTVLNADEVTGKGVPLGDKRTMLHVDFGSGPDFAQAEETPRYDDPEIFNAIGSKIQSEHADGSHFPVLDIDGGALIQEVRGSKVVIGSAAIRDRDAFRKSAGQYGGRSMLRDIFGDYGIEAEVLETAVTTYSSFMQRTDFHGMSVRSITLRAKQSEMFAVFDSSQEHHSHVYIQEAFADADFRALINELGAVGILGEDWLKIVEQEGMGVLRAPWTKKDIPKHIST